MAECKDIYVSIINSSSAHTTSTSSSTTTLLLIVQSCMTLSFLSPSLALACACVRAYTYIHPSFWCTVNCILSPLLFLNSGGNGDEALSSLLVLFLLLYSPPCCWFIFSSMLVMASVMMVLILVVFVKNESLRFVSFSPSKLR